MGSHEHRNGATSARVWTGNPRFVRIFFMQMLPNGTYDVIVIDAERGDDGDLHIEVTISLGPHVGDVIRLQERHIDYRRGAPESEDPYALLGVPGTLRVHAGQPSFRPETR